MFNVPMYRQLCNKKVSRYGLDSEFKIGTVGNREHHPTNGCLTLLYFWSFVILDATTLVNIPVSQERFRYVLFISIHYVLNSQY